MMGKTHWAWGMVGGAGLAYFSLAAKLPDAGWPLQTLGIVVGGLAALLPDLDAEESLIQTLPAREGQRSGFLPLALVGTILSGVLRLLSAVVRLFTKHREATHRVSALAIGTLVAALLTWAVATVIPLAVAHRTLTPGAVWSSASARPALLTAAYIALVFAVGWGSHLFLDALTPEGVHPFEPFWDLHVRLMRIRTSSAGDELLGILGNSLVGVFVVLYCITLVLRQGWIPMDFLR